MTRVPRLGPRGEGWVVLQGLLLAGIALAGLSGPAWSGDARVAGTAVGIALMVAGGALAVRGAIDLRSALTPFPRPVDGARLVDRGAYALVRHPMYSGIVLAAAGWGLLTAAPLSLVGSLAILILFDLKARREEAWLVERYPDYEDYRRRTKRLLPGVY